jgi:hypothetical protein
MRARLWCIEDTGMDGVVAAEGGAGNTSPERMRAERSKKMSEARRMKNLIGKAGTIMVKREFRNRKLPRMPEEASNRFPSPGAGGNLIKFR